MFAHPSPGDGCEEKVQSSYGPLSRGGVRHQYGVVEVHMEDQLLLLLLVCGQEPREDGGLSSRTVIFFTLAAAAADELRHGRRRSDERREEVVRRYFNWKLLPNRLGVSLTHGCLPVLPGFHRLLLLLLSAAEQEA